jgi:hypothetical protein
MIAAVALALSLGARQQSVGHNTIIIAAQVLCAPGS